jgi:hypothetical protein
MLEGTRELLEDTPFPRGSRFEATANDDDIGDSAPVLDCFACSRRVGPTRSTVTEAAEGPNKD